MKKFLMPAGLTLALVGVFVGFQNCGNDSAVKKKVTEQSETISSTNLRIDDLNSIMMGLIEKERAERIKADEDLSGEIEGLRKKIDLKESELTSSLQGIEQDLTNLKTQDTLLASRMSTLELSAKQLEQTFELKLLTSENNLRSSIRTSGSEIWAKLSALDSELSSLRFTSNSNTQEILNQRFKLLEVIQSQQLFEIYANETFASKRELAAQQQLYTALENVTKSLDLRLTRTADEVANVLGPRVLDLSSKISSIEMKVSSQQKDIETLRSDLNSAIQDYRKQHQELADSLRGEIDRFADYLGMMMVHQNNSLRAELLAEINKKALELTLYTNKSVSLISDSLSSLNAKIDQSNQSQTLAISELRTQMVSAIASEQEQRRRLGADLTLLAERVVRVENEITDLKVMTELNTKMINRVSSDFEAEKVSVANRFVVQEQVVDQKLSELKQDLTKKLNDVAAYAENLVKNLGAEVQDNFKNVTLEIATLKTRQASSEQQLKNFLEEYQKDRGRTLSFASRIAVPFRNAQGQLTSIIDALSALQLRFIQVLNPDEGTPDFYNDDLKLLLGKLNKTCGSLENTSFANVLGMDSFQVLSIEFTRLLVTGLKSGDPVRDRMFHSFGAIAGTDRLHQSVAVGLVRAPFGDADQDCKYEIQQWARSILLVDPRFMPLSQALASDDEFERRLEVLFDSYQGLASPLKEIETQINIAISGVRDQDEVYQAMINQTSLDLINAAWDQRQLADRLATLDGFEQVQSAQEEMREEMKAGFSELRLKLKAFEEQTNARLTRLEQQQGSLTLSMKRALDVLISLADRGGYADLRAYARWAGQPINYTPVIYPNWQPRVTMVQHFFSGPLSLKNKTDACTGSKILPQGGIQGVYQFGGWGPCWVNFRSLPLPRWANEFKTLWLRVFGAGHIVNLRVDPAVQKENKNAFLNYNYNRSFDFRQDLTNPDICLFGTFDNGVFDIKTPDLLDFYLKNIRTWGGVTVSVSTTRSEIIGGQTLNTNSNIFNYTIQVFSPLIIDLHKAGLPRTISPMQSRVKTNLVSSDRFEPTGWVRGDEAALLLKKELVEGTKIRREHLFTEEESCEGVLTKNAFETLRCLDTDQNGVINQFDMAFKNLRLLFDFDADGVVDEGEMRDLFDVGVGELSLSYSTIPEEEGLKDGNDLRYVSLLKDLEGKISGKLIDVYFGVTRN
jgi:hypothetical protein